jgi:hypothetical protein
LCDKNGFRGRQYGDIGGFNVEEEPKSGTCGLLAVMAVACIAEERGSEEPVADSVADASACYRRKGSGIGFGWGYSRI